jgi:hypothetical protein
VGVGVGAGILEAAKSSKDKGEASRKAAQEEEDGWKLFLEYLRLRRRRDEILVELRETAETLNGIFDALDGDILRTQYGTICRKKRRDGGSEWELRCS